MLMIALVSGFAIAIAIVLVLTSRTGGSGMVGTVVVGAVILVAGLVGFAVVRHSQKRNIVARQAALEELPANCWLVPVESPDPKLHRTFGALPRIPRSGKVQQVMRGELEGRELTCFQHLYVISTGQTTVPVQHTVIVTDAPQWPTVTIRRRASIGRLLLRFGIGGGLRLEDDLFNRTFKVTADDEEFALTLLSPAMQRFLLEKPSVAWRVNPGCVAMVYRGPLRFDRLGGSIERMRAFWSHVAPELATW
jgi:hypothetical protein